MTPAAPTHLADRLLDAVERAGSSACVGLDPVIGKLPEALRPRDARDRAACASAIESFCLGVIDAVAGAVGVIKPQGACFERYGWEGVRALERTCDAARERRVFTLLDVKRGDIDVTAEHYAAAAFGPMGADAATVNAYMGADTLVPWLSAADAARSADGGRGRGVFVLVRTSNPGSDGVQRTAIAGESGETVATMMARLVGQAGATRLGASGWSDVGAVVGATKPGDAAKLRELMPHAPILVPGWGAQGGDAATVRALQTAKAPAGRAAFRGALVSASRSVLYPFEPGDAAWALRVRDAAARHADEIRALG